MNPREMHSHAEDAHGGGHGAQTVLPRLHRWIRLKLKTANGTTIGDAHVEHSPFDFPRSALRVGRLVTAKS
jgi:hypothetical protein